MQVNFIQQCDKYYLKGLLGSFPTVHKLQMQPMSPRCFLIFWDNEDVLFTDFSTIILLFSLRIYSGKISSSEWSLSPELRPILGCLFKLQVLPLVAMQMNIKQLQHKLSSVFFIKAILMGIQRSLKVILICLFLITKHVKQFLRYLPAISDSSLRILYLESIPFFD